MVHKVTAANTRNLSIAKPSSGDPHHIPVLICGSRTLRWHGPISTNAESSNRCLDSTSRSLPTSLTLFQVLGFRLFRVADLSVVSFVQYARIAQFAPGSNPSIRQYSCEKAIDARRRISGMGTAKRGHQSVS